MAVIAAQTRVTPDDLLNLKDERLYELVNGQLVEKEMGSLGTRTAAIIVVEIGNFVRRSGLGRSLLNRPSNASPMTRI